MATPSTTETADATAAAAGVDAASLLASTDVEARIIEKAATVAATKLAAENKNKINSLWERMQAVLAAVSVAAADFAALFIIVSSARKAGEPTALVIAALVMLSTSQGLVIGFYFGRTNHARPTPTNPDGG